MPVLKSGFPITTFSEPEKGEVIRELKLAKVAGLT